MCDDEWVCGVDVLLLDVLCVFELMADTLFGFLIGCDLVGRWFEVEEFCGCWWRVFEHDCWCDVLFLYRWWEVLLVGSYDAGDS